MGELKKAQVSPVKFAVKKLVTRIFQRYINPNAA
jgi:hypothetical protein